MSKWSALGIGDRWSPAPFTITWRLRPRMHSAVDHLFSAPKCKREMRSTGRAARAPHNSGCAIPSAVFTCRFLFLTHYEVGAFRMHPAGRLQLWIPTFRTKRRFRDWWKIKHALQKTIPILSLGARLLLTRPKLSVVFFAVYSFDPMSDPESLLTYVRSSYAAPCSWLSWHSSPSFYFKAGPPDSPRMSAMLCARLQTFHCFRLSILLRKYGNS